MFSQRPARRFRPTLDTLCERIAPATVVVAPTSGTVLVTPICPISTGEPTSPTDPTMVGWTPATD
jgi:hypothetical protein